MNTPKHWQDEDLMFRYNNDARFYRFVQELIVYALHCEKHCAKPQIPTDYDTATAWPSIEEQEAYWKTHDHGGNILPSRIEANEDIYQ